MSYLYASDITIFCNFVNTDIIIIYEFDCSSLLVIFILIILQLVLMLTLLECSQCTDGFMKGPLQKIPYILETIHKKNSHFCFQHRNI